MAVNNALFYHLILCIGTFSAAPSACSSTISSSIKSNDEGLTIFIHGTNLPIISRMMGLSGHDKGLYPIQHCKNRYKAVASRIYKAAPQDFPLESFYMFGWSGSLSLRERKKAAKSLYGEISSHKGPITLIAHSHGCNVALHVAEAAHKAGNRNFCIDRLILLAPPVQEATAHLAASSVFKNVISCYSSGDVLQVIDPQMLTNSSKKGTITLKQPLFSRRKFPDSANLKQVQILLHKQNPGHRSFLRSPFLSKLPHILKLIEQDREKNINDYIINIPLGVEQPCFMEQLRTGYIPRKATMSGISLAA